VFEFADTALKAEIESVIGGVLDDDQLILLRRISAQGRGSAQANGLPISVAMLQELGARLVDIHGQNEGRALADPAHQRVLLDVYGGLLPVLEDYQEKRRAHDTLRCRRLELIAKSQERQRERDLLEFERGELAAADPRAEEPEELTREAHRLANAEQLRTAAADGYSLLYEADRSAQGLLEQVARMVGPLADSVPELSGVSADLDRLADETREVAYVLRNLGERWDDDPARLEEVEARLALYRRLAARFRCAPNDLEAKSIEVASRLEALERDHADLLGLDAPLAAAWTELAAAATALTNGRRKTAKAFAKATRARLKPLGIADARLDVEITTSELGTDPTAAPPPEAGPDHVEIVFSANPGEPPRPLRKVASGGELSRVTLAVKAV
jgi:DNA repair protein RecN (Recombination protein N)